MTKKRLKNRLIVTSILTVLSLNWIAGTFISADLMNKFIIATSSVVFLVILGILIEGKIFHEAILSTEEVVWVNKRKSLEKTYRVVEIITLVSTISGVLAIIMGEYYLLSVLCAIIVNIYYITYKNSKIYLNDRLIIINGYVILIDEIKGIEILMMDSLFLKFTLDEVSFGFKFNKAEENYKAIRKIEENIECRSLSSSRTRKNLNS